MHIIIPMSGAGNRFIQAGYKEPKPLIPVDGRPVIEYVVGLFPGETKFTFVCNRDHLQRTPLESVLKRIAPQGNIVSIDPHKKGPVFAVSRMFNRIDDEEEVIVNYCDFACAWDYADFLKTVRKADADGSMAAYRGFHPHMSGKTNYAFIKETDRWLKAIKEKEPFTDNRMNEFASSGTYYFKRGALVKKYFQQLMDADIHLNGEYYISLVYNLLHQDQLKTYIYEIQHMLQWGEPHDLREYQKWSDYFAEMVKSPERSFLGRRSMTLMPMAGAGKRFVEADYTSPKPLIDVNGFPMFFQAGRYLSESEKQIFVCLAEHLEKYPVEHTIKKYYPGAKIVALNQLSRGQACSCEIGLEDEDLDAPLMIASCDNGMLWRKEELDELLEQRDVDVIVWSFRGSASAANPQMYGWIKADAAGDVSGVSVKVPISAEPVKDHAVTGAFYFRRARYFLEAIQSLYQKNVTVNGEFYVDSCVDECVKLKKKVKVLETTHYIGWGTPNDLKTYEYWQQFFDQCAWHPYEKRLDWTSKGIGLSSWNGSKV